MPLESQEVTKQEAARRQLATAIELWFHDRDQVSIHTLASAAYEVIHILSEKQGRSRELSFDTPLVKNESRKSFKDVLRKSANFFKHADRDPGETLNFAPSTSHLFMVFSVIGLQTMRVQLNEYESALLRWMNIIRPDLLTESGKKLIAKSVPADVLFELREIDKREFFDIWLQMWRNPARPPASQI